MGSVNTVLGEVDARELGIVLPHEHLRLDLYPLEKDRYARLVDLDLAIDEARAFGSAGGGTIVDVTPSDLGRDPRQLQEIARATGLHVVMGTGRYLEPTYEPEIWTRATADLAREFVRDIEEGVGGVRAGVIGEIGVRGFSMTPAEERVHRAAAKAHVATGAPITTHAIAGPMGLEQLDVFEQEGVDLRCVAVGHADSHDDWSYHEAVLRRGAFLEFDLIRGTFEYETERHLRMVRRVLDAGYVDQLLVSQDVCTIRHLKAGGGTGYDYILTRFAERLEGHGIGTADRDRMLAANPQRFLAGRGAELASGNVGG